jgi:hypothetical protein
MGLCPISHSSGLQPDVSSRHVRGEPGPPRSGRHGRGGATEHLSLPDWWPVVSFVVSFAYVQRCSGSTAAIPPAWSRMSLTCVGRECACVEPVPHSASVGSRLIYCAGCLIEGAIPSVARAQFVCPGSRSSAVRLVARRHERRFHRGSPAEAAVALRGRRSEAACLVGQPARWFRSCA